jgi:hypothetical protein
MKIFINSLFLLIFIISFSQNRVLEMTYEKSKTLNYIIKNSKGSIIGFLRNDNNNKKFEYYNKKNKLVASEETSSNYNSVYDPFEFKSNSVVYNNDGEKILTKFWDSEENRFKIFSEYDEEVGYINYNKSTNLWEFLKNENYNEDSFTNIFKIISEPKLEFNTISKSSTFNNSSNTFIDKSKTKKFKAKKIKIKKIRSPKNRNRYGTSLSLSENDGVRVGADFFNGNSSWGLTVRIAPSDVLYDDDPLSDWDVGMTYGTGIINNLAFLKFGLGFYTYNYDITESFGPFYEIGYAPYYSLGLQLYINLGNNGFTPEVYFNNMGLGYGIGFAF